MSFKRWIVNKSDKLLANNLAQECDIDPIAALILSSRGYNDPFEIDQILSDDPNISSPRELIDIDKAVNCINEAISNDLLIAVFGDYDCDGICATTILYKYFLTRNVRCIYYIPDRFNEGYGMNIQAIDHLYSKGVGLIITVDNGISFIEEIDYAKSLGMKVVVTDHHLPKEKIPNADAVVDPHRNSSPIAFKDICGTVVAYKLICALEDKEAEELLDSYSDFLAVATVGDIMPLTDENRDIVKHGIKKIIRKPSTGFEAIISVAGISRADINSTKIAFGVVPRINASGRMGNAYKAVELLLKDNILEALEIANSIDEANSERHRVEENIFKNACEIIEKNRYQYNRVIVVSGENWHTGVIGIVASKIANKYGKPAIVLSIDGENASGSGRSIGDFSLFNAINSCSELLLKFGGHDAAAGLTLENSKIDEFRQKINEFAYTCDYAPASLSLDCKLNPAVLSTDICYSFSCIEPFGQGNPAPIFGIFNCEIEKINPISSGKHLRVFFKKGETVFQTVLFGTTKEHFPYDIGDCLDLAVALEINHYNGNELLSIKVRDMRVCDVDEDLLFSQIDLCDRFFCGLNENYQSITPTRSEIGEVYKYLNTCATTNKVLNKFIKTLGYAKTYIALEVLLDLNLIKSENGILYIVKNAPKTNLLNCEFYNKLLEGGGNCDD